MLKKQQDQAYKEDMAISQGGGYLHEHGNGAEKV